MSFPCFSQDYVLFCHRVQNKVWWGFYKEPLMVSVWIAPASVTANFSAGPTAPALQYAPVCLAVYERSQMNWENGLESKTCGPINIRGRRFSPFFPILPTHPIFLFLSLFHPLSGFCLLYSTSDPEVIKSQDSHCGTSLYIQTGSAEPLIQLLFFFQSFMISGYKALPGQSAMLCSLEGFYFLLVAILPCH